MMSITDEAQDTILSGIADAMRRAPLVYAVLAEFILILAFAAWLLMEGHDQQERAEAREKALQAQLIECLRP